MNHVVAQLKGADISAQKCRLVVDLIRGMPLGRAMDVLKFTRKKAANIVLKLLQSATANAEHNAGLDVDELMVDTIYVNEGASLKRFSARAKGRGNRIEKQTCHIYIALSAAL